MEAMIGLIVLLVVGAPLAALILSLTLRARIRTLELRLLVLEHERARASAAARPAAEPAAPMPARAEEPAPSAAVTRTPSDVLAGGRVPRPPDPPDRSGARTPAPESARTPAPSEPGWGDLERRLGGTWLNRIGAVVLMLGIAFFLKYAFDNSWIQPAGRVTLGLVAGVLLLLVGDRLQRAEYRTPAQGVIAVGIGALYLSMYAAFAFYQLVTQPVAFAVMVLITATGLALALYHDARAVAVLANLGGFLTPVLLATDRDAGLALFTYLAVLDAGMLVAAWFRRWPELGLMSFVFTQALYVAWFERWYAAVPGQRAVALGGAFVFLLLFSLVAPAEALSRRLPPRPEQLWRGPGLLALAAPIAGFVAAREVLKAEHTMWLAFTCIVLAAYYLALARTTMEAPGIGLHLVMLHGAVSLAFLTLAFPVQFAEHGVAIAWSVEGVAILWGGFRLGARALRLGGLAVLVLAAGRWLTLLDERTAHAGRFLLDHPALPATCAFVAAAALAATVYHLYGRGLRDEERYAGPVLAVGAVASAAMLVHAELVRHTALGLDRHREALIGMLIWLAAGALMLLLAPSDPTRVLLGAATLTLAGVGVLAVVTDLDRWNGGPTALTPLANFRFLVGLLVVGVYALYARLAGAMRAPAAAVQLLRSVGAGAAALLLLWHLSMEIVLLPLDGVRTREVSMAHHMGLSILWTLYAFVAMGLGLQRRQSALRFGAIGLFAVTLVKVFLVDLERLDAGYRILSFVVLGGLLILASFLYTRYREHLAGERS